MAAPRRIGILTSGGDCPGLNAVIRAVTMDAIGAGIEVVGICDGFLGLIEDRTRALREAEVAAILAFGGTILGSSNKADPARFAVGKNPDGSPILQDVTDKCLATFARHKLDVLVVIGGDGTMTTADRLAARGVPCLGVPKTIDNDLVGTDLTFGFLTAVATATDALDRVHTTAASHHRIIAVEVMGRNAGWIALHSGVATAADVILIPEVPFSLEKIARTIRERAAHGRHYSIVCVAEGAKPAGGEQIVARRDPTSPDPIRLGGIAKFVADRLEDLTGMESRHVVLGHVLRGGPPVAADRVLATQFGWHAMNLLRERRFNRMVTMRGLELSDVGITEPAGKQRTVPAEHHLMAAARAVGAYFGD